MTRAQTELDQPAPGRTIRATPRPPGAWVLAVWAAPSYSGCERRRFLRLPTRWADGGDTTEIRMKKGDSRG
jgi:hypothetical protein